jgi:hypothetical protein
MNRRCLHSKLRRTDEIHPHRRSCELCGAIGWMRNRTFLPYTCKRRGCKTYATARSWNGLIEVHFCDDHFEGAA